MSNHYRYLNKDDKLELLEFSRKANHTEILTAWLQKTIDDNSPYSIISAEIIDGKINGIVSACSLSYWVNAKEEFMPVWLGIRTDRLKNTENFNIFMDKLSKLITDHYELLGYFQHYIVRRIPKKFKNVDDISKITKKAWSQGPYTTTVECIVKNENDYNNAHKLFRGMIGTYTNPVVVLFMNITDNTTRESRKNEIRNNS